MRKVLSQFWFLIRRWWKLAGAIFLLSSPVLYLLLAGPLFWLVIWPAQTGDYLLSAKRHEHYNAYLRPIDWTLNEYGKWHPEGRTFLNTAYRDYLDWWKLPRLDPSVDYPDDYMTVQASPYDWFPMSIDVMINPQQSHDLTAICNFHLQQNGYPEIGFEKVVFISEQRLFYYRGRPDAIKHVDTDGSIARSWPPHVISLLGNPQLRARK